MPKNFAATRSVNPVGAEPKLSEDQLWKGLEKVIRGPVEYIPMITKCVISKDEGDKITRTVTVGPNDKTEEITLYKATIAYFEAGSGNRITNLISYDANTELQLTLSFVGGVPGMPNGGEGMSAQELNTKMGSVVQHLIDVIRKQVKEGSL